jgi:hypothetical protein
MEKIYELNWILNNGNLYAKTAVKVMLAAPEDRGEIVTHWLDTALESDDVWEKHEAEMHALAAHLAKEQMNNKIVTEPFPGFFCQEKFWWVWVQEQIEQEKRLNAQVIV